MTTPYIPGSPCQNLGTTLHMLYQHRRSEKLMSQPNHRFYRLFHHELQIFLWVFWYLSRPPKPTISGDMGLQNHPHYNLRTQTRSGAVRYIKWKLYSSSLSYAQSFFSRKFGSYEILRLKKGPHYFENEIYEFHMLAIACICMSKIPQWHISIARVFMITYKFWVCRYFIYGPI